MFIDNVRVYAKAGNGGDGSAHFFRAKYIPKGGPDGGDGGNGGHVILKVSPHTDNLRNFFYNPNLLAKDGKPGSGSQKTGKSGKNNVFLVPPGTVVYRSPEKTPAQMRRIRQMEEEEEFLEQPETPDFLRGEPAAEDEPETEGADGELEEAEAEEEMEVLADLTKIDETFILACGGKGGKGNVHFKSSTNRTPLEFTRGEIGEESYFHLELRRIADVGLVGYPNAGKSTLLSHLSNAKPKIASYPFTTLQPMVGVIDFPGFSRATMADIPGLIEGAHDNIGLGHEFLRHITRCSALFFVLDMAGVDMRNPIDDLTTLRTEVSLYDEDLGKRPWIIIANKMDLPEAEENLEALRQRFPKREILPISAEREMGFDALRSKIRELVGNQKGG